MEDYLAIITSLIIFMKHDGSLSIKCADCDYQPPALISTFRKCPENCHGDICFIVINNYYNETLIAGCINVDNETQTFFHDHAYCHRKYEYTICGCTTFNHCNNPKAPFSTFTFIDKPFFEDCLFIPDNHGSIDRNENNAASKEPSCETELSHSKSSVQPSVKSSLESSAVPSVKSPLESSVEPSAESSVEPSVKSSLESSVESSLESSVEPSVRFIRNKSIDEQIKNDSSVMATLATSYLKVNCSIDRIDRTQSIDNGSTHYIENKNKIYGEFVDEVVRSLLPNTDLWRHVNSQSNYSWFKGQVKRKVRNAGNKNYSSIHQNEIFGIFLLIFFLSHFYDFD